MKYYNRAVNDTKFQKNYAEKLDYEKNSESIIIIHTMKLLIIIV